MDLFSDDSVMRLLSTERTYWFEYQACYEIKKSVGCTFDTSRCCRKWFSISYTKRKLRNCEWPLKLLEGKNQHLLGKFIFENWPKYAYANYMPTMPKVLKLQKL